MGNTSNRARIKTVETTLDIVQFITEEHGERVYMYTYAGPSAVKTDATIGKRGPLHVSAAGKAILANLLTDDPDQTLYMAAENKALEWEKLEAEFETVRERGYAFNDEESNPRLRAVSAPVRYMNDTILGAVSVSGPANRLTGDYFREEFLHLPLGTVNKIELNIEYL